MRQTFQHVSIFLAFLALVALGAEVRPVIDDYFRFDFGPLVLLWLFAASAVVLWHLLFHYFGKLRDTTTYIACGLIVAAVVVLAVLDVVPIG